MCSFTFNSLSHILSLSLTISITIHPIASQTIGSSNFHRANDNPFAADNLHNCRNGKRYTNRTPCYSLYSIRNLEKRTSCVNKSTLNDIESFSCSFNSMIGNSVYTYSPSSFSLTFDFSCLLLFDTCGALTHFVSDSEICCSNR